MSLSGSQSAARTQPWRTWSQLKERTIDAEHLLVQRLAGTVFMIRVVSAALAFGSQVLAIGLLARAAIGPIERLLNTL